MESIRNSRRSWLHLATTLLFSGMHTQTFSALPSAGSFKDERVEVHCTVTVSAAELKVIYTVQPLGRPVLLFDVLPLRNPSGKTLPAEQHAWVSLGDDKKVKLLKGFPKLPESKEVLRAYVPWCRLIPAGQTLKGEIHLPLPLLETNPYFGMPENEKLAREEVSKFKLVFDYALAEKGNSKPSSADSRYLDFINTPGGKIFNATVEISGDRGVEVIKRDRSHFEPL